MRLSLMVPTVFSFAIFACFSPTPGGEATSQGSSSGTDSSDGPASCVPGQLQPCNCPNGMGNQACNDAGSAYGPCECGPGATGDTGPVNDTGSPSSGGMDSTGSGSTGQGSTDSAEESGTTIAVEDTGGGTTDGPRPPGGPLNVGEECDSDAECMTNVCWDFNDYDPFCFGSACSVLCGADDECVGAMTLAGAPDPGASSCGGDGRCTTLGTGFGAYACAGPS